jgi:hypothetical protein
VDARACERERRGREARTQHGVRLHTNYHRHNQCVHPHATYTIIQGREDLGGVHGVSRTYRRQPG